MPRPKKTEAEIQSMRERILDTALILLQAEGPQALSSRAIAEQLGVAHMSLFTYFENQAAILSALREREMAVWRARQQGIEQRAAAEEISGVVKDMLEFYSIFARENPNLYRLAWVMPEKIGESTQESRQRMQDNVELLARLLQVGMQRGAFAPRPALLAAATVLGMVNMPYILYHSGKLVDPSLRDRMVDEVLGAAMVYLKSCYVV